MNKLQSVRYQAAYSQLAQKLDMHIKNFDSDPNTQIRWVWELIQNAKDAPNVFKKTKIKQYLDEYFFVSSHNGDAFEIGQLHSVVAQYSTKKEKNSALTKTTGKYETGFITTYILSKIIELEGILKVEIDNDSEDEENQNSDDDSSNEETLSSRIKQEKQKPSKYKNNQKIHRLVRTEVRNRYLQSNHAKKMKSSYIRKKRSNDMEKMRNRVVFEKEMERLMIEEQIEYEEEMKLLEASLAELSTGDDNQLEDFEKRTNFKKKEYNIKNKKKSTFYYKKFAISMDRSYTDRDQQLPKKIERTQKRLTKIVLEAQYQSTKNPDLTTGQYYKTQRTVDSFDTTFRYKLSDKKKFEMIERTLSNAKELIPYAFLFNDNLSYYEFVDRRKETKEGLSFAMTKGDTIEIANNIFLFTIQVEEDYSIKEQKFMKARIDYFVTYFLKGKAIAAIPVHIDGSCIQILQINPKLPKFFKDFPLIGCSDHKWNAFINSREFYPNQKRSELMLTSYDETNLSKVQTNWERLYECFTALKDIYVFLSQSQNCKAGLQNLFILSSDNMLTQEKVEFKVHLEKLIRQISSTNFIPNRLKQVPFEKSRTAPKNFIFIEMANTPQECYNKTTKQHFEISYQANRVFSFLYGEQCTLNSDYYQSFYLILNSKSPYREFLHKQKIVKFLTINDCLKKMETLSLAQIRILLRSSSEDKLHEVYSLLQQYNEDAYLSLSKPLPFFDFKIFLSEKDDLRSLRSDCMKFNALPPVYEDLAENLQIKIRQHMINKKFSKYIKETDNRFFMDIPKLQAMMLNHLRFVAHFYQNKKHHLNPIQKKYVFSGLSSLKTLFSVLLTFDSIKSKTIDLIKKFVDFSVLKQISFATNKKELRKLGKHTESTLLSEFVQNFKVYFEYLINNTPILKNQLTQIILIKYEQQAVDFMKSLFSDELLGSSLCDISMKLSWENIFKPENTLKKLDKNVDYPELLDIQIYNINFRSNSIFQLTQKQKLQQKLVHSIYPRQIIAQRKQIELTTYNELYQNLRKDYGYLNPESKYQILNYISQINQKYLHGAKLTQTIIQKHKAWQTQINNRLSLLFDLKNYAKAFEDEDVKEFLYSLINNPTQLKNAQLIYKNNCNKMYFNTLCEQLNIKREEKTEEGKPASK